MGKALSPHARCCSFLSWAATKPHVISANCRVLAAGPTASWVVLRFAQLHSTSASATSYWLVGLGPNAAWWCFAAVPPSFLPGAVPSIGCGPLLSDHSCGQAAAIITNNGGKYEKKVFPYSLLLFTTYTSTTNNLSFTTTTSLPYFFIGNGKIEVLPPAITSDYKQIHYGRGYDWHISLVSSTGHCAPTSHHNWVPNIIV